MKNREFAVLVADENAGCVEAARETLAPQGYGIIPATTGREALRIIHRELIHIVVMDVRLPDYSGFAIYHAIKHIRARFLPCIFTAVEITPASIQEAMGEEAVTILPKPVDARRLIRAVDWSVDKYYPRRSRRSWRIGRSRFHPPRRGNA